MSKLFSKAKEVWVWVLGFAGLLLAAFHLKSKYDSALAKEKLHDTELKDKDLEAEEKVIKASMSNLEEDKKKALDNAKDADKTQVEDFYKK